MKKDISDAVTEIYNNLHRQATNKCLKEKDIAQAKYEGYEQALCDFTRALDSEIKEDNQDE